MKLDVLNKFVEGSKLIGNGGIDITGIEYDSRRIKPGMLFFAVSGFKKNGLEFIGDAIKNGAVAVVVDSGIELDFPHIIVPSVRKAMADIAAAFYGQPGDNMIFIGVTGTNGKSSSVYLIQEILKAAGKKVGAINSLAYDTVQNKYKAERTTPEAPDLQKYFYEMRNAGCTHAVIEVSSHALVLYRVEDINFKVGLYTNFSRDHLDFHKTMVEYLKAKKLLLGKLDGADKYVVLNADVKEYASFVRDVHCNLITYSVKNKMADVHITDIKLYPDKSEFTLVTPTGSGPVTVRLPGRYNLSNVTGAAAAGMALEVDAGTIIRGLENAAPVPGRFQPVDVGQPFSIIIDYAHTPDAITRLCQSAREIARGEVKILFGCGGDRDTGKRALMGEAASTNADYAVITSDNPRTEDPLKIIEDVKPGMKNDKYKAIPDRREAVEHILAHAKKDDMLLFAGKGAENYQEIGNERFHFEDKLEIIRVLETMGYKKD